MNMRKLIWCTTLVFAVLLIVKGEEEMPRKQKRKSTNITTAAVRSDGTGNLSKQRREELIGKINEIRAFLENSGDTNATRLIAFAAELEKEVRQKKYGLVFEQHKEHIDVILEKNLPVLTEVKPRFIDNGGDVNFLIEGDNLAALKLLEKTHRGRIDVIYIDPPYNTGNKDFIYNDSFVDSSDAFRHSKWLSFMEPRLRLARSLMSDQGVIFISINDLELAGLRLLCDEIFDERNFLCQLTWEKTTQPVNAGKAKFELQKKVESILCFAKSKKSKLPFVLQVKADDKRYPHEGRFGKCRFEIIEKSDAGTYRRDTMKFTILGQYPREGKRWQIGEDTARQLEKEGKVEIVDGIVKRAVYPLDELDKVSFVPFWSHLTSKSVGTALDGKDELNTILGRDAGFDTVKPEALIRELLSHFKNDVMVLDFFVGSGTTGHAVMKLNSLDNGKRKFIVVTDNENKICETITYERLKRIITKENYKARLKYFKIEYLPIEKQVYFDYADDLLKHIRELVELENAIDFNKDETIAITVTDDEFEKFVTSEKKMSGKKAVYVGHDVLIGAKAKQTLERNGIEIKIIPEYYYADQEG